MPRKESQNQEDHAQDCLREGQLLPDLERRAQDQVQEQEITRAAVSGQEE